MESIVHALFENAAAASATLSESIYPSKLSVENGLPTSCSIGRMRPFAAVREAGRTECNSGMDAQQFRVGGVACRVLVWRRPSRRAPWCHWA